MAIVLSRAKDLLYIMGSRHSSALVFRVQRARGCTAAATTRQQWRCASSGIGSAYRTIKQEIPEPMAAVIKGEVPAWINGSLIRNGPGLFEVGNDSYNHLFDGLSLLTRFNISGGKVTYQSRFLRSDSYVKAMEQNRIVVSEFGTLAQPDPCLSIFGRFMWKFQAADLSDNCNVNCLVIGDKCYAMTETKNIRRIDPVTLETYEKVDLSKTVAVHTATAHPHVGNDGTVYNMGSHFSKRTHYNIIKVPPLEQGVNADPMSKASILCSIPSTEKLPSYFHSFGMTDNYLVFLEQPLVLNPLRLRFAKLLKKDSFSDVMKYQEKWPARFHLIKRDTGELVSQKFLADAFFCFHHINAYEEAGHVVVDLCSYKDESILNRASLKEMQGGMVQQVDSDPKRFVLPLEKEKLPGVNLNSLEYSKASAVLQDDGSIHCTPEFIADTTAELPTVNYGKYNGKPYKYFYGTNKEKLLKVNTRTATSQVWTEDGCLPSEPIFVPAPEATSEDDGVVICAIINLLEDKPSFLLVLDARDLKEVGRAEIDAEVPMGIHGMYMAN